MSGFRSHAWPGVPLALGAAVLFGASTPLSKLLLGAVDPWLLAGVLYLGAGGGLAAALWLRPRLGLPNAEAPLTRADFPWLAAVVVFGGILGPLLLMLGLSRTSAASGALLLISAACLCWGIDNNLTRKLSSADPVQIAAIKGLVAGGVNFALAIWLGAMMPGAGFVAAGAVVGFLGVGVSLVLFMLGLRHLGAARTGAYFSLAPFIGAILGLALFKDTPGPTFIAAAVLMLLGLWLHLAERHDHEHQHEALEHDHLHSHDDHHQHAHEGPVSEPHSHWHRHEPLRHRHPHYPDLHHRHDH